jgi:hypothetical protein
MAISRHLQCCRRPCPRVRLGNDRVAKMARKSVELLTPAVFFRPDPRWSVGCQRSRNGTISCGLSAKSPAGSGVWDCLWKTFRQIFASIPGPLLHRAQWFCPSPDGAREILFAATASGSSSVTSRCLMDVALGFHHRKQIGGVVHLCPALRVDNRWVSNWNVEHKSSKAQQSEILKRS